MRALAVIVLAAGTLAAGCGGGNEPAAAPATSAATADTTTERVETAFPRGEVAIEAKGGRYTLSVEIAETPAQQELGLMFRESLPRNAGMVFVFPDERRGGFWMKDTFVPLSIAFYDRHGRIRAILDMDPCREEPCPIYDPHVAFRGALEVNQGLFADWGVAVGDRIRLYR